VLGADTRATAGTIVAEKACSKIHYISPNMYCCGAGTAAGNNSIKCQFKQDLRNSNSKGANNLSCILKAISNLAQYF